jgi:hypothetical protein
MESWRATIAVLASRGEVDTPRVVEARTALNWHRCQRFFAREIARGALTPTLAEKMLDQVRGR